MQGAYMWRNMVDVDLYVVRLRFSDSRFFQTQIFLNHCFGA